MAEGRITREENRQRWRDHIEGWRGSGQGQQAYCVRNGLTLSSFQRWRRIFRDEETGPTTRSQPGRFVPVQLVSESQAGSGLVLVVNEALRIEVGLGFDATTLRQLVAALGR